jgi:hypothetical protein
LAAEERHFGRAAKRLGIAQQPFELTDPVAEARIGNFTGLLRPDDIQRLNDGTRPKDLYSRAVLDQI